MLGDVSIVAQKCAGDKAPTQHTSMLQSTLTDYSSTGVECPSCGKVWDTYHQYGSHYQFCGEGHPLIALVGEDKFREKYLKMGSLELEKELPCDDNTIIRAAETLGIKKPHGAEMGNSVAFRTIPRGHEYWQVYDGNREKHQIGVHRLLAVAEYGFEPVKGKDVHHINGIPWDNRPENIVPIDHAEHPKIHHKENYSHPTI